MACRSDIVRKYKKTRDYKCEACGFKLQEMPRNNNFMEVHHLIPVKNGGQHVPENFIVLCPNCHAILHSFYYYGKWQFYPKSKEEVIECINKALKGELSLTNEYLF